MAKAPALSAQILALKQELAEAKAAVAELETKLRSSDSAKDQYYKYWLESKAELDNFHLILDMLPGIRPRRAEGEYSDLPIGTRFLSWAVSLFLRCGGISND
jgi:hypothetical protein